jgi:dTDP-4-dehydrorhamnose 3,5-epimerase
MNDKNFIINLEKHQTKDIHDSHINGELTVIWRDWDKLLPKNPEMVYVNTINPNEIKGPHLHKNRTTYFYCISGEIAIIIKDDEGIIHELSSNSDAPILISVPNKLSAAIVNPTKNISKVLVLADVAWKPNDNEMINVAFDDYDWNKWKKNDKRI